MKIGRVLLAVLAGVVAGCAGGVADSPTPLVTPSSRIAATPVPSTGATNPVPSRLETAPASEGGTITDRYADGLPRSLDGRPVLRGAAALAHAQSTTDDTPFLIGGWVTYLPGVSACPNQPVGDTSWLHDCVMVGFSDLAGAEDPGLTEAVTFRFVLHGLSSGPAVAEVDVHDPRASSCGSAAPACERLMVVRRIVWAGDQATQPRPLSAEAVQTVIQAVQGAADMTLFGPSSAIEDCGSDLSAARLYLVANNESSVPAVTLVELEPSSIARNRALSLATGPEGALKPAAVACTSLNTTPTSSVGVEYRWLAVQNVALLVRTHDGPTSADGAFLDALAAGLEGAASSGG